MDTKDSTKVTEKEDAKTGIKYRMTKTKPANFNDLKARFDKSGDIASGTKSNKTVTTTSIQTTTSRFQRNTALRSSRDKLDNDIDLLSQTKFSIDKDGVVEPQVAVSRVFQRGGNKVCQATVENKLQKQDSGEISMAPKTKSAASSILSANIALARVRPGSGSKKEETTSASSIQQNFNAITKNSYSSTTSTTHIESSSSGTKTENRSYTSKFSSSSTDKKLTKETGLSHAKVIAESNVDKLSRTNSSGSDLSDTRSNISRNNSFNKVSTNTKPRPFSPTGGSDSGDCSVRTYKTQTSSLTRTASAGADDVKPEWMEKREKLVSNFQTRLKHRPVGDSIETKPIEKSKTSNVVQSRLKETKSDTKISSNVTNVSKQFKVPLSPRGSNSSNRSNSPKGRQSPRSPRGSLSPRDNKSTEIEEFTKIRKNIFERRESKQDLPVKVERSHSSEATASAAIYEPRKMTADIFKKLKSDYEKRDEQVMKEKIHVHRTLIERKHSFENSKSSSAPGSRLQTLKRLQEDGKIPNVRAVSSSLNLELGRPRAASTGSITADLYNDNIYEAMGEEYHDFDGFEKYSDSSTSDSEAIYDYIRDTDPNQKVEKKGQFKAPARRYGQKRKGLARPRYAGDSEANSHDPSSSEVTEGSSRDGTLESTDDRGLDADVEYDSDSSGIYEPIDPEKRKITENRRSDIPPELPADRKKKKDKDKQGKTFGSKLKQMYKSKSKDGQKEGKKSKLKHVTSDSALQSQGSSGMLNKLGKLYKRVKSDNKFQNEQEEIVLSSSDYDASDTNPIDENIDEESDGITMGDIDYIDATSTIEGAVPPPLPKVEMEPPLPPKPSKEEPPAPPPPRNSATVAIVEPPESAAPPPLPPRLSIGPNSIPDDDLLSSPPLPPKRLSMTLDLDTIVPISLGNKANDGKAWPVTRDSYLHGHHVNNTSDTRVNDAAGESNSDDVPPPRPSPPVQRRKKGEKDDYIQPDPASDGKITVNGKQPLEKRPSSGYLRFGDVLGESSTDIPAPFSHLYKYKNQLQDDDEDNRLYIDLTDDQLYGRMDRRYTTKFESEPLYQMYNKDIVTRASRKQRNSVMTCTDSSDDDDSGNDGIYEAVEEYMEQPSINESVPDKPKMSTLEMFGKTGSAVRALWSEMPVVKESGFLNSISSQERKIQEAMFEIITSEASYLKSLNILINTFLMSQEFSAEHSDRCVVSRQERHVIFSNIGAVREASESFLSDLEARWQKSCLLSDVCDIIYIHGAKKFDCYVRYCSNQTFQERAIQELSKRPEFIEALKRLERSPECQGLPMTSFLLLPMQRITRLPLLVDAICHRLTPTTERHTSATRALNALNQVVRKCNEGARKMQQTEQMCLVVQNLEFKVKEIPLISVSRYLVKQGELTRLVTDTSSRLPFGKGKVSKQSIYLYLFSDILLVSKKKGNNQYIVTDHASRNALHVESIEHTDKSRHLPQGAPSGCKNLFVVVLLENFEQKQVEFVVSCKSTSEKSRWIDALSPVTRETENEKIYEEWDCPQVQCIRKYVATEPDELTLEESDVVNVFKKMNDEYTEGWYEGERIRDCERGWFPANCTEEIMNSHVRARNLRLRYRLLAASEQYSGYNAASKSLQI